ncbi:MAG: response regulator transcription factor [Dehalococcoidia bacterium]
MRILVVEDDDTIRQFVVQGLREARYAVDSVCDGSEALSAIEVFDYDVVVLDIGIPKVDGMEVCQRLRAMGRHAGVLMLTARDSVNDRVEGLDAGADDYLVKPFAFVELLARIRALLRRGGGEPAVLQVAGVTLNPATHAVTVGGQQIYLSNKEFMLLEYLMRNAGRVATKAMICEHVWDADLDGETNFIEVYIYALRKKIDAPGVPSLIQTVRGAGYRLQAAEA